MFLKVYYYFFETALCKLPLAMQQATSIWSSKAAGVCYCHEPLGLQSLWLSQGPLMLMTSCVSFICLEVS